MKMISHESPRVVSVSVPIIETVTNIWSCENRCEETKMIYIIRHGQTDLNQRQILQGRSNYPLNEDGLEQARTAAGRHANIHFEHVYSSPLLRALQTARIIAPDSVSFQEEYPWSAATASQDQNASARTNHPDMRLSQPAV